jgi:arginyl-tRNA synthetase
LKPQLEQLLREAVNGLVGGLLPTAPEASQITVERTRDAQHGDFATNVAMRLAKSARRSPRELAEAIAAALPANDLIERTEIAAAGFINFHVRTAASTL